MRCYGSLQRIRHRKEVRRNVGVHKVQHEEDEEGGNGLAKGAIRRAGRGCSTREPGLSYKAKEIRKIL